MKFEVIIDNTRRIVELERDANRWRISLDGEPVDADAVEIAPSNFSILLNGRSHEIRVTPTPSGTLTLAANTDGHTGAQGVAEDELYSGCNLTVQPGVSVNAAGGGSSGARIDLAAPGTLTIGSQASFTTANPGGTIFVTNTGRSWWSRAQPSRRSRR